MNRIVSSLFLAAGLALSGCSSGSSASLEVPPPSPEHQAVLRFADARRLDSENKRTDAVKAYKDIQRDFPDSPQAQYAEERVRALGGS